MSEIGTILAAIHSSLFLKTHEPNNSIYRREG